MLKQKRAVCILTLFIALFSLIASAYGVFSSRGVGYDFQSIHGQTVEIYGMGLYQYDSKSVAVQAVGQDIVTLFLAIPLLIVSLALTMKGRLKGKLLLTGALGYFLYTYTSYAFTSMYNPFFLIYVALMSLSFYTFVIMMMSFDREKLRSSFDEKFPFKVIGGLLIFIGAALAMIWLKLILTPLMNGTVPDELEHYTTLPIQAMDLGFIVPAAILTGVLLIRRRSFGYLLAPVIIIKGTALIIAITVMMIMQAINDVPMSPIVVAVFCLFDLIMFYCLFLLTKHAKEPAAQ